MSQEKPFNEFYLGLLNNSIDEKIILFEKSLESSNEYIRRSAAEELALLMMQGIKLSDKTNEQMRRFAYGWWADVFEITSPVVNREKIFLFLLGIEHNSVSFDQARHYLLNECEKQGMLFTDYEMAVINGHHAAARLRYNDALAFFRVFQEDGKWPQLLPDLFFKYPNLINDLGRTFQFTQFNSEGYNLFLNWEANLCEDLDDLRFRLLFYAARISRRMGQNTQAISLFEKALLLAPDYEQQDACIWYILDLSISGSTLIFFNRLEQLVPSWHNGSYYNNIMERYLVRLVTGREWGRVIRTFNLIKDTNANIPISGFAWVIARVMEEGYLSADDKHLAAQTAGSETADPSVFFQIAYNAGESLLMPGLYYRMKSAEALELPLLVFSQDSDSISSRNTAPGSEALQFLLGFFNNDAVSFVIPYIRLLERTLSPDELRTLAEALEEAKMYPQSMRLISLYMYNDGYKRTKRDLELMYPRPFLELVELNAQRFNFLPSLLYGLIRTESAFQEAVVSRAGAVGLSQLMPGTAIDTAQRIRRGGGPNFFCEDNNIDSTDPYLNLYIGSYYLNFQREGFNDVVLALMAYNGGRTRVRNWRNASNLPVDLLVETVPIYETRDYGRRVPAIGQIYQELYYSN